MKTTIKIILSLDDNELKLIWDTIHLLRNINNLFDLDPEMRKQIEIAMDSLAYIYNETNLDTDT